MSLVAIAVVVRLYIVEKVIHHPDHSFTVGLDDAHFLLFIKFTVLIANARNIEEQVGVSGLGE